MATEPTFRTLEMTTTGHGLSEPLPHQTTEHDREVTCYMRTIDSIMESSVLHYRGMTDLLIQHGRFWTVQEYPESLPTMPKKRCFDNAFQLARRFGFRYVEGIALGIIPVHHAWNVDDMDRVIDPTWATVNKTVRCSHDIGDIGTSYYGIDFPMEVVKMHRIIVDNVMVCSVLNNYGNGYAIYRQPLSFEMIKSGAVIFNRVEGGEIYDDENYEAAIRRAKRRRKTIQVSREKSIASDSGVSDQRRVDGARQRMRPNRS